MIIYTNRKHIEYITLFHAYGYVCDCMCTILCGLDKLPFATMLLPIVVSSPVLLQISPPRYG